MNQKLKTVTDFVLCPGCREMLTRDDLEEFGACPYCNHKFEFDDALEDFLLRPVVEQWLAFQEYDTSSGGK
ncbi:MAG: hypothetical protein R6V56_05380 [Lentisphaeria bacterium]